MAVSVPFKVETYCSLRIDMNKLISNLEKIPGILNIQKDSSDGINDNLIVKVNVPSWDEYEKIKERVGTMPGVSYVCDLL